MQPCVHEHEAMVRGVEPSRRWRELTLREGMAVLERCEPMMQFLQNWFQTDYCVSCGPECGLMAASAGRVATSVADRTLSAQVVPNGTVTLALLTSPPSSGTKHVSVRALTRVRLAGAVGRGVFGACDFFQTKRDFSFTSHLPDINIFIVCELY